MTEGKTMTNETLREWIEKAQFTVTSPTHAPHVNEPIQVVTVEGLLAALAGTYLSGVSGRTDHVDTFFARLLSFAQGTGADADGVINNPNLDGDAKFAARAFKLLEDTLTSGDGSESAGLRDDERIKGSCWRCGKPVLVKAGEVWHSKDDVVWHEVCSYQEQIETLTTQLKACRAELSAAALAPAISRPPTQGSQVVAYLARFRTDGGVYVRCLFHNDDLDEAQAYIAGKKQGEITVLVAVQPPSLPPSRADFGGDRPEESK